MPGLRYSFCGIYRLAVVYSRAINILKITHAKTAQVLRKKYRKYYL
jgi:hypothetical protein